MKKIIALCMLATLAVQVHARLGESEHACTRRYGKSMVTENDWKVYQLGPYHIEIYFNPTTHTADMIAVQRRFNNEPVDMSVEEIRILLDANVHQGATWYEDATVGVHEWQLAKAEGVYLYHWRSKGVASATYDAHKHSKLLLISSNPKHPIPSQLKLF